MNTVDALTKFVDSKSLKTHIEGCNLEQKECRHAEAPEMADDVVIETAI